MYLLCDSGRVTFHEPIERCAQWLIYRGKTATANRDPLHIDFLLIIINRLLDFFMILICLAFWFLLLFLISSLIIIDLMTAAIPSVLWTSIAWLLFFVLIATKAVFLNYCGILTFPFAYLFHCDSAFSSLFELFEATCEFSACAPKSSIAAIAQLTLTNCWRILQLLMLLLRMAVLLFFFVLKLLLMDIVAVFLRSLRWLVLWAPPVFKVTHHYDLLRRF